MDEVTITLIKAGEATVDELGQYIEQEERTNVMAQVTSVSQSEFMSAGQMGFKPSMEFRVWQFEYSGEKVVEYNGTRYAVYRTYKAPDGRVELYTEDRVGEEVQD